MFKCYSALGASPTHFFFTVGPEIQTSSHKLSNHSHYEQIQIPLPSILLPSLTRPAFPVVLLACVCLNEAWDCGSCNRTELELVASRFSEPKKMDKWSVCIVFLCVSKWNLTFFFSHQALPLWQFLYTLLKFPPLTREVSWSPSTPSSSLVASSLPVWSMVLSATWAMTAGGMSWFYTNTVFSVRNFPWQKCALLLLYVFFCFPLGGNQLRMSHTH